MSGEVPPADWYRNRVQHESKPQISLEEVLYIILFIEQSIKQGKCEYM